MIVYALFLYLFLIDLLVFGLYRTETVYTGLEGFPNNAPSANDISVIQDGYGLMISELLAGDFSNCSSVPGDVTSMHSGMGLPNGEVPPLTVNNWFTCILCPQ